jgi:hypothetical protein
LEPCQLGKEYASKCLMFSASKETKGLGHIRSDAWVYPGDGSCDYICSMPSFVRVCHVADLLSLLPGVLHAAGVVS